MKIDACDPEQILEPSVRLGRPSVEGTAWCLFVQAYSGQPHPFLGPPCGRRALLVRL